MLVPDPWSARRVVGGDLMDEVVQTTDLARLEVLRRRTPGVMTWEFEQPTVALFWFSNGFRRARLRIDGAQIDTPISREASLGVIAANSSITGEFDTDAHCDYSVAFLDESMLPILPPRGDSVLTFADAWLTAGFEELRRHAIAADPLVGVMLEGWGMQALARLSAARPVVSRRGKGLPAARLREVVRYIETTPAAEVTIADLAGEAGYSVRHFTRAFTEATGSTPMRFVTQCRIRRAKELLAAGGFTVTDVAYMCGFSHPQHFANTFKRHVGIPPSEFARLSGS